MKTTNWPMEQQRWVHLKWGKIRRSQQVADRASAEWNKLNNEINEYLDRSGEVDILQRAKIKGASLPLKDAFERGKWHAAESQRHIDDLMLFLKLKEMGLV